MICYGRCNFFCVFVGLTLYLLLLTSCDQPTAVTAEVKKKHQHKGIIVAVGDSLTAGLGVPESENYPSRLGKRLAQAGFDYQVINSGVSGETSSGTLARLNWILRLNPDIVILATGANDGLRGIDPKLVRDNIEKSIRVLLENDVDVVLAGMKMMANLGPEYLAAFDTIYPDLAERYPVSFLPFLLDGVAMVPKFNQPDGIHPTGEGYGLITDTILPVVIEAIRKREDR